MIQENQTKINEITDAKDVKIDEASKKDKIKTIEIKEEILGPDSNKN